MAAQPYLIDPAYAAGYTADQGVNRPTDQAPGRLVQIFNLYKSYRYQSSGYYVSLLAEARAHKPLPKVNTIQDLQSQHLVRHLTKGLDTLIQRLLAPLVADNFELNIHFGRSIDSRYPLSAISFSIYCRRRCYVPAGVSTINGTYAVCELFQQMI